MAVAERRFNVEHPRAYAKVFDLTYKFFEWRGGLHVVNAGNLVRNGMAVYTPDHESGLDFLAVGLAMARGIKVPGKKELKSWRYGWLPGYALEYLGGELFDREGSAADAFKPLLGHVQEGNPAVSFIERTRKNPVAMFKPEQGAAWLAIKASAGDEICPLIPVGLSTSEVKLGKPVQVVIGEPYWLPENLAELSPKEIKQLRQQVTWDVGRQVLVLREQALQLHRAGAGLKNKVVWNFSPPEPLAA